VAKSIAIEAGSSPGAIADTQLKKVERALSVTFPAGFLEFLRASNGGVPVRKFFLLAGNEKVVERFLSIIADYKTNPLGMYDIEVTWSQIEDRLTAELIPFAALFAGDFLCFDFSVKPPAVMLWNHDYSSEDSPDLTPVARSFEAFCAMLHD